MVRVYLSIETPLAPKIPDIIKDAFKDTSQFVKIKAVLGVDAEELLSSEKPLLEHLLKGFKFTTDMVFLKNIKNILLEELGKNSDIREFLQNMGPALGLTSNSSIDFTFDDFDDVREHPMANKLLVSLGQIIQGAFGGSIQDMLKYSHEFKDVD